MTFTFKSFSSDDADKSLWQKIITELNSLSSQQRASVKIGASDEKSADARAVIFFTDSEAPDPSTLGSTWSHKEFTTRSDYEGMYNDMETFLNTKTLTDTQKYFAQLSFTNARDNDATLVLYYREQS